MIVGNFCGIGEDGPLTLKKFAGSASPSGVICQWHSRAAAPQPVDLRRNGCQVFRWLLPALATEVAES